MVATTLGALAARPGPYLDELAPGELDPPSVVEDDLLDTGLGAPACDATRLVDGVLLPESPALYKLLNPDTAWASRRMADTLAQVAEEMAWRFPGIDPLVVGDISRRGGGPLAGHRSHRGGIDADLGLYETGGRMHQPGFRAPAPGEFDVEVNLAFVLAMLETGNVERIYLDQALIRLLRDHAVESGTLTEDEARAIFILPEDGVERTWALAGVVEHVRSHHHHYHLRVFCGD